MKWSEDLATGIPRIDHHHDMLFRITERFRTTVAAGQGAKSFEAMLRSLKEYASAHFDYEERCMEECGCAMTEINRAAHGTFRRMVMSFQTRYDEFGFSADDALQLVAFLENWLADHVGNIDVNLKGCAGRLNY